MAGLFGREFGRAVYITLDRCTGSPHCQDKDAVDDFLRENSPVVQFIHNQQKYNQEGYDAEGETISQYTAYNYLFVDPKTLLHKSHYFEL